MMKSVESVWFLVILPDVLGCIFEEVVWFAIAFYLIKHLPFSSFLLICTLTNTTLFCLALTGLDHSLNVPVSLLIPYMRLPFFPCSWNDSQHYIYSIGIYCIYLFLSLSLSLSLFTKWLITQFFPYASVDSVTDPITWLSASVVKICYVLEGRG